jgi:hypothetical protein
LHENLPIVSKDIHRSFLPKVSNTFRLFLPKSKQLYSSGFHGYIIAFMSFLPYSKVAALVTTVTSAKDGMRGNHGNPTM